MRGTRDQRQLARLHDAEAQSTHVGIDASHGHRRITVESKLLGDILSQTPEHDAEVQQVLRVFLQQVVDSDRLQ